MNVIHRIDGWILGKFQKFSEWSEVVWDKNCYMHASYAATLMSFSMLIMSVATVWDAISTPSFLFLNILALPFSLMFLYWAWMWRVSAAKYKSVARGHQLLTPPPLQYRMFALAAPIVLGPYLVLFTMLGIAPIYNVGLGGYLVGAFLHLNFASCLPSPPEKVRRRQMERTGDAVPEPS